MTIDLALQNMGRATGQWWQAVQCKFQGLQSYIGESLPKISQAFEDGQRALQSGFVHVNDSAKVPDTKITGLAQGLELWRKNPTWIDESPSMEVSVPTGSLCQLNSTFKVGLPPMAVFDILSDPENKRVFKDIQEVRYRKVLEDDGDRQVVELEQAAIWRFLWLSGTLSVFVRVTQDRKALSLQYELGKPGYMKRFEGFWHIEPIYVDGKEGEDGGRVASLIRLQQVVEPALMPPPPISWYVRSITTRTTEKLLEDLQAEGKRLRETSLQIESTTKEMDEWDGASRKQKTNFHRYDKLSLEGRVLNRRTRRKRWRHVTT